MRNYINKECLTSEIFNGIDEKEFDKYVDTLSIIDVHINNGNVNDALKYIVNASNFIVENLPDKSARRKLMNYVASELVSRYEKLMLLVRYRNNHINDK